MDDEIILAVSEAMPKFDRFMLQEFTEQEINSAPDFIDKTLKEAVKLVNGAIQYKGYRILKPDERVKFELGTVKNQRRHKIQLASSEVQLIEYMFEHAEEDKVSQISLHLYTPYLHNNMLVVRDKQYGVHRGIDAQVFARIQDKSSDGVMIRPIRAPIPFNRRHSFKLISSKTGKVVSTEFVITGKLHSKKPAKRRRCETTVIHYLICKFGFYNVLSHLGVDPDDVSFVDYPVLDDHEHEYFAAKESPKGKDTPKLNNLHMKVRNHVLKNKTHSKLIANILYTLNYFDIQTADNLVEPAGSIWRVMLGLIIYPGAMQTKARSDADTHIASVDSFIDPNTRDRFNEFNVRIENIYDMLYYVFVELDRIVVNSTSQDLYNKRIDVTHGILVEAYCKSIFERFYKTNQKSVLRALEVKSLLKIRANVIEKAYASQSKTATRNISTGPQIFNDNWLEAVGIFKIRHAGYADQRFHPSMGVVESMVAFSGSNIGSSGYINPYLKIMKNGGIVRPDYADDIDLLLYYLPQN